MTETARIERHLGPPAAGAAAAEGVGAGEAAYGATQETKPSTVAPSGAKWMSSLPAWAIVLFGLVVSFLVVGLFLISSSPTPRRSTAEMPVETLQRLANEGNAKAQNDLGLMYQEGHGVPRDDAEAVKWFWKAADQGNANSQYNLGVMYANGQGLARDYVTAGFSLAAAQGDADAVKQRELLLQKMTPAQIAEVGVLMGR